ncbi:MAG: hypothetical protein ABIO76_05705 [Ginsengibacter sp.]
MNIFKLIFELFIIYLGYKLVFGFIIPVYRTTKQMKQKMNDMHQKMQQQQEQQNAGFNTASRKPESSVKALPDDYIEYEEVK